MSQQTYDYIVIGSGLTGLGIANKLSQEGARVALLDGADAAGGLNRGTAFPTGKMNNGLRWIPDTDLSRKGLDALENILGLKILAGSEELPPVTFEEGKLKSFVGFGDKSPEFDEQLRPFTTSQRLSLHLEPWQWAAMLFENFTGEFLPRSYVTRLVPGMDGRIDHVIVNGAKHLKAQNIVYTGSLKDLGVLLPPELLAPRARQKLSKNAYWTALCLDLCHAAPVTDSAAMHVLNGTTQDEVGPCVGFFHAPVEENGKTLQASQWMTFFDEELSEDSEVAGQALKKIKRQIKRAYPTALDGLIKERIVVAPAVCGTGDLKLNADQSLPGAENLWIASAPLSPAALTVNALNQAQLVLASLGFSTSPMVGMQDDVRAVELTP